MSLQSMDSIPNEFLISLQSWPLKEKDPNSALPALIQRINIERGGFRDLSEDGLRQEIAEAEAGEGEDSSDEEEEEKPDRLKELVTAREEMLQNLE
jgi:mediator of RNA polymerase II transcription subunit 17